MTDSAALDNFLDKWRRRWPEWQLAEGFVPPAQRRLVLAWFALLQEFEDIMNIAGDPLPADAKLGWWAQELRDWSARRSRHPLGRVLEPVPAPWSALAEALPALQLARSRPDDIDAAIAGLRPLAQAVSAIEAVLFSHPAPAAPEAGALQWLYARWQETPAAAAPAGLEGQWSRQLLNRWPRRPAAARPRRIWSALARLRLRRELAGRTPVAAPLSLLWQAWRAARGGP